MTAKELAIHSLEDLPENATWDDVQERINFMAGVRKALQELDAGKGVSHQSVREESARWPAS